MALTKVTGQVVNTSTDLTVGVLTATTVSVGGTLTYEDVTNVDSVGLITARNGIEVTDKGVQVGTGATVDSAAANTLTFLTGGSERVRVSSGGDMGLGTASPTARLDVRRDDADGLIAEFHQSSGYGINIKSSQTVATIQAEANQALTLETGSSATERLRITSAGDMGLGTTSPTSFGPTLQVAGTDPALLLQDTATAVDYFGMNIASGAVNTWFDDASAFVIHTATGLAGSGLVERLRIDSSGRLLLGTTTEGAANADNLTIADSGHAGITIRSGTSSKGAVFFSDATSGSGEYEGVIEYQHSNNDMLFFTSGSEGMRLDSSGNFGIGTASPAYKLSVESTSGTSINIKAGTSSTARLRFGDSDDDDIGQIMYDNGGNSMRFHTNASEQMRIDSSGRLLLGTTTAGNASADDLTIANSGAAGITIRSGSSASAIYFADGTSGTENYQGIVQYNHTLDALQFYANYAGDSNPRMLIDSSGRLMLGTSTTASLAFTVYSTENSAINFQNSNTGTGSANGFYVGTSTGTDAFVWNYENGALVFATNNTASMRIDNSGRLLIGTTTSRSMGGHAGPLQVSGTNFSSATVNITNNANSSNGAYLFFSKQRSGSVGGNTILQSGDLVGQIRWLGADGTNLDTPLATIDGLVDGTPGENDMPGRIVFSTTADGAASPTERVRITSGGYFKASNNGTFVNSTGAIHEISQSATGLQGLYLKASSSAYANDMLFLSCNRASNANFYFMVCRNSNTANNAILLRGDGNAYADGSWNGGGADYAEYFEWSDGNASAQDRRGISVVLDGDKIREAVAGEEPIGVISGNPSVVGDGDVNQWKNKHLRDDYGSFILDENGDRQVNPDHNPDLEYIPRENRPEWDCVGLMGKLRIRKGQITGSRWIKMRDVSDTVEEWLVR